MKFTRSLFALAACAMLASTPLLTGCAGLLGDVVGNNGTAISNAADATVLDEQVGTGATIAYTAASTLGRPLAENGIIDKAAYKRADNLGFAAITALRQAYLAGNQRSYLAAASQAYKAVADIQALVPKKPAPK